MTSTLQPAPLAASRAGPHSTNSQKRQQPRVLLITGLSGAGHSTAL